MFLFPFINIQYHKSYFSARDCFMGAHTPLKRLYCTAFGSYGRRNVTDGVTNPVRRSSIRPTGFATPLECFVFWRLAVTDDETLRTGLQTPSGGRRTSDVQRPTAPDGVCNPVGMFRFLEVGSYGRRNVTDGVTNPVRRTDAVGRPAPDGVCNPVGKWNKRCFNKSNTDPEH